VHGILAGWRKALQDGANGAPPDHAAPAAEPALAEPSVG
jgi:hypothetical protein